MSSSTSVPTTVLDCSALDDLLLSRISSPNGAAAVDGELPSISLRFLAGPRALNASVDSSSTSSLSLSALRLLPRLLLDVGVSLEASLLWSSSDVESRLGVVPPKGQR